jgi:hypothetical protein
MEGFVMATDTPWADSLMRKAGIMPPDAVVVPVSCAREFERGYKWQEIDELPVVPAGCYQSDSVLGYYDNGTMEIVFFDAVEMSWKDAAEHEPVRTLKNNPEHWQTIMTHWCKLPTAP